MAKGELAFVEWLRGVCPADPARVPVGIGDDMAAVALEGRLVLVTADMLLDGVHFVAARQPLDLIGRKAMGCSLSDCAAMACQPRAAVVSVAFPDTMTMADAQRLYEGMLAMGREYDCPIVGGDTTSWGHPLAVDVSMLAEPMTSRGPVQRDGARPGDVLMVTGRLGGSLRGRHLCFRPRLAEARRIANQLGASLHAMMDISDGLALDAFRMCRASGCGARFASDQVDAVISDAAVEAALADGRTPRDHAFHDGEDFELLMSVAPDAAARLSQKAEATCRPVGVVIAVASGEPTLSLRFPDGRTESVEPRGYEHFR